MIVKSKVALAHGAMPAKYQSRFNEKRPDAKRREHLSNQFYLFLVLWVIFVCAATDGVAAIIFHVG